MNFLSHLDWDPNRICFTVPYINFSIAWYGVFFALGFFVSYFFFFRVMKNYLYDKSLAPLENHKNTVYFTDRFMLLVVLFTVIGARVGYIFFYGWPMYKAHPEAIFNIREGGLASHGGVIGALLAMVIVTRWLKKRFPKLTFMSLLDGVVVAAAFAGGCIRIGNFMNQEITGTPTTLPWGVHFVHPMDGHGGVVHPVQLYESIFYFFLFGLMYTTWIRRGKELGSGFLTGLFFLVLFTFRFCIEFCKTPQGEVLPETSWIRMGQLLSIPFILVGIYFLTRYFRRRETLSSS